MTFHDITTAAASLHLTPLGGFHERGKTTILLGPMEPGFWDYVSTQRDFHGDDPLDNWSQIGVTQLADRLGAWAVFPFGGPPYHPFIAWALNSGAAWQSPVGLLVHADAGLLVSYRGALVFDRLIDLLAAADKPCDTCVDKPCLTACPVNAIGANGYDVPKCKAHIAQDPVCAAGCRVRLACPVSQTFGRNPAQTAFHMKAFVQE